MLSRLNINWFFPETASIDKENFTKVKVTVYGLLFILLLCLLLFFINTFITVESKFPFILVAAFLIALLFIFKHTASFTVIGNLVGALMAFAILPLSLNTGGIYSEDLHGIFLIPLVVLTLAGFRSGLFWLMVCCLWLAYVVFLSQSTEQLSIFREQVLTNSISYYIIIISVNLAFPFLIYYLLHYQYLKLIDRFKHSENVLEHKNEVYAIQTIELERTQKELERSNTELEQYAHATSHDLKQPIRTINGFANLLNQHLNSSNALDETSEEYVNLIIGASNNMNTLVSDLLAYAKLTSIKEIPFEKQSINKVLDTVLLSLKNQIESNEVVIEKMDMPTVKVVPVKINQLFQNIISNAIKFKKKGETCKIEISAEELSTHYKFSIKDNGIGIDEKFQEKIFAPFIKLHSEVDYTGSGIGLATCKRIVDLHKGEIWAQSTLGKGTTFHFTLQKEIPNISLVD